MSWSIDLRGRVGELALELTFECGAAPTAIIGPNGAGKTTLLRAIAGAPVDITGTIALSGRALTQLPPESRRIGYVPQGHGLFPHLSVVDNVAFGCDRERALATLDRLDAKHLADRRPRTLSGGERQRIALARALAHDPAGLLLDEPLASLDIGKRRQVRTFLAESLREAARPTLVVTHDARDVIAIASHVVVIEHGRVTQTGTPKDVAAAPASEFVAEFFATE